MLTGVSRCFAPDGRHQGGGEGPHVRSRYFRRCGNLGRVDVGWARSSSVGWPLSPRSGQLRKRWFVPPAGGQKLGAAPTPLAGSLFERTGVGQASRLECLAVTGRAAKMRLCASSQSSLCLGHLLQRQRPSSFPGGWERVCRRPCVMWRRAWSDTEIAPSKVAARRYDSPTVVIRSAMIPSKPLMKAAAAIGS